MTRRQFHFQTLLYLILISISIHSVEADDNIDTRPAQITFFYPLGTNGMDAANIINNFSVNMLWGISAGVQGAEFGGLLNYTNGPVRGAQFAGLSNIGISQLKGAQFAGLLNTSSSEINGVQAAGFMNMAGKHSDLNDQETNLSQGAQFAGFLNINTNKLNGIQTAGFMNIQSDSIHGMQVAGFMNMSTSNVQGVQLAGFLNMAKNVKGVQIGVINISDSIESGIPIGLINIVRNGYRVTEVETNNNFYTSASYKMGVKRFYSIFSIGFKSQNNKQIWAPGFGVGTYFDLGSGAGLNIDAITYHVNEDDWWTNKLNELNTLKLNGSYQLFDHLSIYGGVSVNVLVSQIKDNEGNPGGGLIKTPNAFYDEIHKNTHVAIFPGWNVGLRF